MKVIKYLAIIALFLGGLWMVGCRKDEPEQKFSIEGEWGDCRTCDVRYTFPKDGIMSYQELTDGRVYTIKYRLTADGDSLQFIDIMRSFNCGDSGNGIPEVCYFISVQSYRIHFYTNDSIMIEKILPCDDASTDWRCDATCVRIK